MKKLLVIALLLSATLVKGQQATVDTSMVGKNLTVCGFVDNVGQSKSSKITFINFDEKDSPYTGVIYAKDTVNFTEYKPMEFLKGKNICISGVVSIYKGKPQIVVSSPKQIKIQDK
ncbi:MAG: hypothetical protein ABI723_21690 [Bacteroidia bacterium]